jgi:hypothetical protein
VVRGLVPRYRNSAASVNMQELRAASGVVEFDARTRSITSIRTGSSSNVGGVSQPGDSTSSR